MRLNEPPAPSADDARRRVASVYAAEAIHYRDLWAPALNRVAIKLVPELPSAESVLDLGTGVGTLLPALRDMLGARLVLGVDVTREMLTLADASFGRVVGDAACLPIAGSSFEIVVAAFVLFHVPEPREVLAEAKRVLRPDGTIGTITWESDSGSRALDVWNEELERHGAPEQPVISCHEQVDRPEKIAALLEGEAFSHVRAWTLSLRDELSLDGLIKRRLGLGSSRRRLESLGPDVRDACMAEAIQRLRHMPPDDFVAD